MIGNHYRGIAMDQQKIKIINDGQTVDEEFVNSWEILDYCDQYNGKLTISFVGVVIKNKNILFSFPKHYKVAEMKEKQDFCMKQILYILSKNKATYGSFDKGLKGEFPVKSYNGILNHYKKYGLYLSNESYFENGYEGNADWNRTINKSNKVVQKNGVIFFPFVIKKTKNISVFISECMGYVLADASNYRNFITTIIPYEYKNKNPMFRNLRYVVSELKKIRNLYCKDIEKKIISALAEGSGKIISRDELCNKVWNNEVSKSRLVQMSTAVGNIRKKIAHAHIDHVRIITYWGNGYRLHDVPNGLMNEHIKEYSM